MSKLHNPRIQIINEELEKIAKKRDLVEKRIEFRLQTIDKFHQIHEESLARVYEQTIKQNEEAKKRNYNLLRQIGAVNGALHDRPVTKGRSSAAIQLEHAKKSLQNYSSKLYPAWKEQSTLKRLNTLKALQQEKDEAERRRLKNLHQMRQEYNIRTAVEEERRQLLLALSLEQRDQLEASAKLHILRDKGKAVESELQTQFQLFGDEYERYIAEAATRGIEEAQQIIQPLFSVPKEPPTLSGMLQSHRPVLQVNLPEYPLPKALNEDAQTFVELNEHKEIQTPQKNFLSRSPSPPPNPSNPISSSNRKQDPIISPKVSSEYLKTEGVSHPPAATPSGTQPDESSASSKLSPVVIEQDKLSATLPLKPPPRRQLSVEQKSEYFSSDVPELTLPVPQPISVQPLDHKNKDSNKENPIAPLVSEVNEMPVQAVQTTVSASIPDPSTSIEDFKKESPRSLEPEEEKANDQHDSNDDNENITNLTITESLSAHDLSRILSVICSCIENLDEPLVVKKSYYAASNPSSSPNLTKSKIENAIDSASMDELGPDTISSPEILTWIILKIAEEKGSYLLPSEILNGVVSIEKLVKIHKKLGGGRYEVWNALMNHLRRLIELKKVTQEEISKLLTTSLITHLDDAEKSRNERKVMKLVQLSVLPHEKEVNSRPPTPQKRIMPPPDPSPTPPGTPGYERLSMISAPPSPSIPPPSKLLPQRGIDKLESSNLFSTNSRQSSDSNLTGIATKRPSYDTNPDSLSNKILKAATVFQLGDDDEIEDDDVIQPLKSNPTVLKDISSAGDDEFDF